MTLFVTPAPSLHTVCVRGARYYSTLSLNAEYDSLIRALEARAPSGVAPLRHLSVGSNLLRQTQSERDPKAAYRAVSETFLEINEWDHIH